MSGLIGSLQNSSGALRVHSKGLEVAGKNLANINNRGYSKERVEIGDRGSIETGVAFESMGVEAMGLRQNRDALLDKSVMREITSTSSLEAAKKVLESAETALGQFLDRTKDSTSIQNASGASGGGISDALTDFFNAWESFSVKPNDSGEKQLLIAKAQILADKINATDKRLAQVQTDADAQLTTDVSIVNGLLAEIAKTNEYIAKAELVKPFSAVDLRDQRQAKLEELAQYIDVQFEPIVPDGLGQISVKSGNVELINGKSVLGAFEYDATAREFGFDFTKNYSSFAATPTLNAGKLSEVKLPQEGAKDKVFDGYPSSPLPKVTLSGGGGSGAEVEAVVQNGKITSFTIKNPGTGYTTAPTISVSGPDDVQYTAAAPIASGKLRAQQEASTAFVQDTRDQLKSLAQKVKAEVNAVYKTSTNPPTTIDFFSLGSGSPLNFQYNTAISSSLSAGSNGGNKTALDVAKLGTQNFTGSFEGSFTSNFNKTVTTLAQKLNTTNIRLEDQKLSQEMALNNRDQYSGVSQDEEMTDMMKFQRSFQASARHINVIDTLLEQVVNRLGVG
jgi:flagellar hook-associated protein 1 FlgK